MTMIYDLHTSEEHVIAKLLMLMLYAKKKERKESH
jgi:hypothetical protein